MCAATDDLPCRALLLSIGTGGDTTTSLLLLSSLDWHKQKKTAVLSVCAGVVIALKRKSKTGYYSMASACSEAYLIK